MDMNTKLTAAQQALIADNLDLIEKVIRGSIKQIIGNPDYSYEDLYQSGCVGICKAAIHFKDGNFQQYARKSIRNAILDYCQEVQPHSTVLSLDMMSEELLERLTDMDYLVEEDAISKLLLSRIEEIKKNYSGITAKGITAIELKLKGMTGADIAKLYGVETNHVSAWIARARTRLLADKEFLGVLA